MSYDTDGVWALRDWLLRRSRRIERSVAGFGQGVAEDAVHEVLARAADEGLSAAEVRAKATSLLASAIDKLLGNPYSRWRKGLPTVVPRVPKTRTAAFSEPYENVAAPPHATPLAHSFPDATADDRDLAACATMVADGMGMAEMAATFGAWKARTLRKRLMGVAAEWAGRPAPAGPRPTNSLARSANTAAAGRASWAARVGRGQRTAVAYQEDAA